MENFLPIFLQVTGMQVLESAYIIHNSNNIKTVISRQGFLQEKYNDLLSNRNDPSYATYTEMAIATYKERYYDRPLQDVQLAILNNPVEFNLVEFYCESLVNTLKRFCAKQSEEISQMKLISAKQKRTVKTLQIIQLVRSEMTDKYSTTLGYEHALNEIDKLGFDSKI
ncbi:MAG TPA: hypothetical protein VK543_00080 [Puia sp.]|nr:hypothetical protein [Puia sp.]